MSYSDYTENAVQDHIHGGTAFTQPAAQYLALFSIAPTDAGGGTELTGSGYARQSITFSASSGGIAANTNTVTFTASGGDWSAAVHGAVFDALTAGNMLEHNAVTSVTVLDGSDLVYAAGTITSALD